MKSRVEESEQWFREGYNCSQSVFGLYHDVLLFDRDAALKVSASFGGGMGRMREVCGTLSGDFLIAGMMTGTTVGSDAAGKKRNYDMVQRLAGEFRKKNGSIYCRDLLGLNKNGVKADTTITKPDERTEEYYRKRPCIQLIKEAAFMAEEYLLYPWFSCDNAEFIRVESETEVKQLAAIANEVWHQHFASILSPEQIDYMVEHFQSEPAMKRQMEEEGYEYYFIRANDQPGGAVNVGYVGVKVDNDRLFLSKLYILQRYRGNRYASGAFEFMRRMCKVRGLRAVWLTVNRYNYDTIAVYKKKGFVVTEEKVTDIGNGFVMDDYFMEWDCSGT